MQHCFFSKINFEVLSKNWTTLPILEIKVIQKSEKFIFWKFWKLSDFWKFLSDFRITLSFYKTHILNRKKGRVLPSLPKGTDLLSENGTTLITIAFSELMLFLATGKLIPSKLIPRKLIYTRVPTDMGFWKTNRIRLLYFFQNEYNRLFSIILLNPKIVVKMENIDVPFPPY